MQFTREIQRIFIALMIAFLIVALSASYWAVIGSESLLIRDDNARLFEDEASVVRGTIFDRNNIPLVGSVTSASGRIIRNYLYPEIYGITGYYSLQYGVGGAEFAYDTVLKGSELPRTMTTFIEQDLLHRPRKGSDVRLTLDIDIQQQVVESMQNYTGAVVVLAVPSGEVLAITSLPTFNPNQLDETWEVLRDSDEKPFFNRALQGRYQPGGVLQTPIITAALMAQLPLTEPREGASEAIDINGITIDCAGRPPSDRLTLTEAYAFACPAPFQALYESIGLTTINEVFNLFKFGESFTINGFPVDEISIRRDETTQITVNEILGQGNLTVTPLHMAMIAASMINQGNAPQPYLLQAVRAPDSPDWVTLRETRSSIPITTPEISLGLQQVMREATKYGNSRDAARSNITIGGHASTALSGDQTLTWFIGNAITGQNQGIAVALVLEGIDDTREASFIGGQILETAYEEMVNMTTR